MRIATTVLCLSIMCQPLQASDGKPVETEAQAAACRAWADQLRLTTRRLSDHALLGQDEAAGVRSLIDLMDRGCSGRDPARIAALYAILLDTLVDQRHQP